MQGALPDTGPLANTLVTGLSQKTTGPGAVATDTTVAPASVLYTIRLQLVIGAANGIVFDGTAADWAHPETDALVAYLKESWPSSGV